jgi:DMSO/TMAO reductase YedYZ molybdopterin-dependent catalytic subunit
VGELTRAGIRTGILIAPLMPGINDAPEQIAPILEMASEAGAAYVTGIALHLRGDVKNLFFEWLREHRPDLIPLYARLYQRGAYLHPDERRRMSQLVKGPELAPGERMRGRLEPRGGNERHGAGARDGAGRWRGAGRPERGDGSSVSPGRGDPVTSDRSGWLPDQGRLF